MKYLPAIVFLSIAVVLPVQGQQSVVVVYDDSGSMAGSGKWWYANYAVQSLVGLLTPEDELLLVRMSQSTRVDAVDLSNQKASIETLRAQHEPDDRAGTPYAAVLTAMDAVAQAQQEDRWLIVISDGAFENVPALDEVRRRIQTLVGDTGVRVRFLLIGRDAGELRTLAAQHGVALWQEEAQADVYAARGAQEIIERLQQIAADVTSRTLGAGPVMRLLGDTLLVDAAFPLQQLTLFEQATAAVSALGTVHAAETNGTGVTVSEGLDLEIPASSNVLLSGRITSIRPDPARGVLPTGQTRIVLNRTPDLDRLRVLPSVAARLDVYLIASDGAVVPATGATWRPCLADSAVVRATLITPSGDTLMAQTQQPERIQVELQQGSRTVTMRLASPTWFVQPLIVDASVKTLSVRASYPGYFNFRSRLYRIEGQVCAQPRAVGLAPVEPWQSDVAFMKEKPPLELAPTADGTAVAPRELSQWTLEVVDAGGYDLEVRTDSARWTLKPLPRWGWPQLTPADTFRVRVRVASSRRGEGPVEETLTFILTRDHFWALWGLLLTTIGLLIFLVCYAVGLLRKPRFARGTSLEYRLKEKYGWSEDYDDWQPLPTSWPNRWLVPYRAERRSIAGVRFKATRMPDRILVDKNALSQGCEVGYERVEEPVERDYLLGTNEDLLRREGRAEKYTFRRSSDS